MVTENAFAILRTDQQLQSPIHDFALCFQARELLCLANQGFVDIDISAGHEVTIHQFRWNWCIAAGFQKQYLIPFVFAATVSAETAAQTKVGLADIQRAVLLTDEGKTALEALKAMDPTGGPSTNRPKALKPTTTRRTMKLSRASSRKWRRCSTSTPRTTALT